MLKQLHKLEMSSFDQERIQNLEMNENKSIYIILETASQTA
jgi:hypothetical protein